jgi:DNA-binding NtrC family response regulator
MLRMGAILVFENDYNIAELISAILSDEGYTVRTTLDSLPVWAARPEQLPALIVLDLALPPRTVTMVRDYARRRFPFEVPVVITTTNPAIAIADTRREGVEYLLKPFALEDLLACVARYVQLPCGETQPALAVEHQEQLRASLVVLAV